MTPDDQLAQEIRKSGKAREVLENEAFKESVQRIDEALLIGMRNAAIADDKLRLRLLDKYEALHTLLDELQSVVNTGMLAEEELRQRTVAQRIKDATAALFN